jgi:FixJ family two-component response regulator
MPLAADRDRRTTIVFVVDDDAAMREALSSLLRAVGWQVQTFATAAEFLDHRHAETPACLLLDVRLPGSSGLELQRTLAERGDGLPIVFMTGHGDIPMSVQAMKAGAVEFLPKPFREHELLQAIELALERDTAGQRGRAELADIRQRLESLSTRQREVMGLVVKGLLNKQAAAELNITEVTVTVHRRRVMKKMGAHSLPDLVRMVERVQPTVP